MCTTLGASCVIRGRDGERVVPMEEFHRGPYETAVGDGEMLVEVRFPIRPDGSSAYEKVERRAGDWAVVVGRRRGLAGRRRRSPTPGVGLAAVGPNTTGMPAIPRRPARPARRREELYAEAGAIAAEQLHARPPTSAAPRTTSATWPTSSPGARCAARSPGSRDREGTEHAGHDDASTAKRSPARSRPGCCWCTSCATTSASPARTGAATRQQLRHLRGVAGRRAGQVLHRAGGDGRRPRGPHRRGPGAGRRARPGAAGLHGVPRPAVRVLHAGHDDDRPRAARPQPRPDRARDPRGDLRARSAGAPATRPSCARSSGPPAEQAGTASTEPLRRSAAS